jgi:hypothetical protein|tara:strand:+ start:61 stop:414 length:354 start_codon:yes stop_codon:yes gene_type:complete
MTWEDILKREPISIDDRRSLMDVNEGLAAANVVGAHVHIMTLGSGNWWNNKNYAKEEIGDTLDFSHMGRPVDREKIIQRALNKTLTLEEWKEYLKDYRNARYDYIQDLYNIGDGEYA